jgi:hypothetical protein
MIAVFDGQDYSLYLDGTGGEMEELLTGEISASLIKPWGEGEWGKTVILKYEENDNMDEINLRYLPDETGPWDDIEKVEVTINQMAYAHIQRMGRVGTRYNAEDKIDIYR